MKFMLFMLPVVPGTKEERRRLRPIAGNTERFQSMLEQTTELARVADDLGFDMIAFPEHFLQTEGLEMGGTPSLYAHLAAQTKDIKIGPMGFVLPGWNPLRLACEVGWLDQITRGRIFLGLARGYQTRWLNPMAQQLNISATMSDQSAIDLANREAFDEVLKILKLAWGDEPFSFKGDYYEYPYPYETGTPWPPHKWTEQYGAPGEVVDGNVRKIFVVPKPYQRPHPPLFQAFSVSESTIVSCARNGIVPMTLVPWLPNLKRIAELYRSEAHKSGYNWRLGERIGVSKYVYIGADKQDAYKRAQLGSPGTFFYDFSSQFGFCEALRMPEDEEKYPSGKVPLPPSEWTIERMDRCGYLDAGTPAEVRRRTDKLVEEVNPEYYIINTDQGLRPQKECIEELRTFAREVMDHYH
jgi:alkanesulfonate monooxygenase SsuD/methylene tetrahydromethanopterin reductase-like flavin-dependent oxidoreductase (luciferase family)